MTLKWNNVYSFIEEDFREHIIIKEHKTGKENIIAMNSNVTEALTLLFNNTKTPLPSQFIFTGRDNTKPLSRSQAFRIIKNACQELQLPKNISCHSLRKTFGYHAWNAGTDPVILMYIFNHSDFQITKRYLGIDQDDKDNVFLHLNL